METHTKILRRVVKHIESTPNLPSGIDHATIRSYVYGLTDKMALHYAIYGYGEAFDKLFRIRDRIVKNKRLRMVWVPIPRLLRWLKRARHAAYAPGGSGYVTTHARWESCVSYSRCDVGDGEDGASH